MPFPGRLFFILLSVEADKQFPPSLLSYNSALKQVWGRGKVGRQDIQDSRPDAFHLSAKYVWQQKEPSRVESSRFQQRTTAGSLLLLLIRTITTITTTASTTTTTRTITTTRTTTTMGVNGRMGQLSATFLLLLLLLLLLFFMCFQPECCHACVCVCVCVLVLVLRATMASGHMTHEPVDKK